MKTKHVQKIVLIFLFMAMAIAQDARPTVAILDFEGQDISLQEVQTLTERMRSEIGATNAVRLIERKAIENIMAEQGLAQSGCVTDECAAEVGQLLGVQYMVNGSIGKLGDKYTIDVKMFSVETGAAERTVSATHEGDVSGLLIEMQILAWEIVGLQAPQRLRLQRAGEIDKPTVAVLDFEGRGISILEAQTLTDRFTTSMNKTDKVQMVGRGVMSEVLEEFSLKQNYPNPFNPVTTIQFGLPQPSNVRLTIVNILGQEVTELVNDWRDMGFHQVRWAGVNDQGLPVSTGVYFSILTDGQQVQIRKMLLVK